MYTLLTGEKTFPISMITQIQVPWFYDKNNKLKKETFDTSDAYVAGIGYMQKHEIWKVAEKS